MQFCLINCLIFSLIYIKFTQILQKIYVFYWLIHLQYCSFSYKLRLLYKIAFNFSLDHFPPSKKSSPPRIKCFPPLGERNFYFWKNKPPTWALKPTTKVIIVTTAPNTVTHSTAFEGVYFFKSNKFFLSVLTSKIKHNKFFLSVLTSKIKHNKFYSQIHPTKFQKPVAFSNIYYIIY